MTTSKLPLKSLPTELIKQFVSDAKIELSRRRRNEKQDKRRSFIRDFSHIDFDDSTAAIDAVKKHNSENKLSLRNISLDIPRREKYFKFLMAQDWSAEFPCDATSGDYYVYCHVDPTKRIFVSSKPLGGNYGGEPFYVGKGVGNRAYDLKRNQGHGKILQKLLSDGWTQDDMVHIAFSSLSESKAYELESKLIYFFGTIYEKERKNGALYNLNTPKTPTFEGIMEKIPTRKSFDLKKAKDSGGVK